MARKKKPLTFDDYEAGRGSPSERHTFDIQKAVAEAVEKAYEISSRPDRREVMAIYAEHVRLKSEEHSEAAKRPRKNSLVEQVRQLGIKCYAEVRTKAPALWADYTRLQLTNAISKSKKKSP